MSLLLLLKTQMQHCQNESHNSRCLTLCLAHRSTIFSPGASPGIASTYFQSMSPILFVFPCENCPNIFCPAPFHLLPAPKGRLNTSQQDSPTAWAKLPYPKLSLHLLPQKIKASRDAMGRTASRLMS